ncbi:MAG: M48 family metallopeptidase [Dehalococcoidales bacterium]|jgi:heat shock protein HtpX
MWEQIRSNQIRSVVLVIAMGLLLLAVGYAIGLYFFDSAVIGLVIALALWVLLNLIGYFQGDSILLSIAKAKKITRDDHPRLFNVVEEMKIATGLPKMPDIYIIDDTALNAFATGRDPERASVAITSGLLARLNRDELQGVIAHEMSHIKNRDVLLMALTAVMLGSIVILAWFATRALFFSGGRRSSGGGGQAGIIILIVGLVFIILAPIAAQFIYFAISRKREYLADASAALHTRYPEGLASALEKLGTSTGQLKTANKATAPMYIINPFHKKGMAASNLSATHPPLKERIRILRSMAGGASFAQYDAAYQQVHKTSDGIMSAGSIAAAGAVGLRGAKAEEPTQVKEPSHVERTRETADMLYRLNKYKTITCACGTKLKVPPRFKDNTIRCPHCGRVHRVK